MDDSRLIAISVSCALIGLVVLYYISNFIEPISANDVTLKDIDKSIEINGYVEKITTKNGTSFINIAYKKSVPVVLFKSNNLTLKEGDYVKVAGKVAEYNDKEEIMASTVKLIS